MSKEKRKRQKESRRARREAEQSIPDFSDADLDELFADVTVRVDCQHASTRTESDGVILTRCAVGAAVAGGCPRDCASFERRRVGGLGFGAG